MLEKLVTFVEKYVVVDCNECFLHPNCKRRPMLIVKDRNGKFTQVNDHALKVTRLKPEQVLGRTAEELYPHNDDVENAAIFEKAVVESEQPDERIFVSAPFSKDSVWIARKIPRLDLDRIVTVLRSE